MTGTTAVEEPGLGFGLGRVTQISFVVDDLDRALPAYEAIFGPFRCWSADVDGSSVSYRGKPAASTLRIGLATSGDVDIELVAVEAGEHPAMDHLRATGPGIQHIAFEVDDLEVKRAAMLEAGFEPVVDGTTATGIRFCHLQAPDRLGYTVFELMQLPEVASA